MSYNTKELELYFLANMYVVLLHQNGKIETMKILLPRLVKGASKLT